MPFPVNIFYTNYTLADFSPFGYTTKLSESIGKIPYQLLQSYSTNLGGTLGSSLSGVPEVTIVLPVNIGVSDTLMLEDTDSPGNGRSVIVSSYNKTTKTIIGTTTSLGVAYTNWSLSPLLTLKTPLPISYGGVGGELATLKKEVGTLYPHSCMQQVREDFTSFSETSPNPWEVKKLIYGAGTASAVSQPFINTSYVYLDYVGVLKLSCASSNFGLEPSDRTSGSSGIFMSYGSSGFISCTLGGTFKAVFRVALGEIPTALNVTRFRVGLRASTATKDCDFLNSGSMGFEISGDTNGGVVTVVTSSLRSIDKQSSSFYMSSETLVTLTIEGNTSEGKVYFYVGDDLVHSVDSSTWKDNVMYHPCISFENPTFATKYAYVDYAILNKKISRGF